MNKEQNILKYLQKNPDFLTKHANTLGIRLKESKIRAFNEGQLADYEQQMQHMANNMNTMLHNAQDNHQTIIRLMKLNTALMACNTLKQVHHAISGSLKTDFNLPLFALRLLIQPHKKMAVPTELELPAKAACRPILKKLTTIQCADACIHKDLYQWLPENADAESFLHLPLRVQQSTIGILLLAHPDAGYFTADTPTDYMAMTGEAISATLTRIMGLKKS